MAIVRRFGCCSTGPAPRARGSALGQLDEATLAATSAAIGAPEVMPAPGVGLRGLFAVSVGAGLTVWALTKWLSER